MENAESMTYEKSKSQYVKRGISLSYVLEIITIKEYYSKVVLMISDGERVSAMASNFFV